MDDEMEKPESGDGAANGDDSEDNDDNASVDKNKDNMDNISPNSRIREYPIYHKGPFIVFIKKKITSISFVAIARKLNESYKNCVKSIMKVNPTKMRVELTSAPIANAILKQPFLQEYRVYIPAETVEIDGIVSISQDVTVDEIVKMGKGKFSHPGIPMVSVNHAHRYSKRVESTDGDFFEPLDTMRISFSGTAIPKWLCIYNVLFPVRLYNPQLMTCKKCLGDHHTEKHCTSQAVCRKCKGPHLTSDCKNENPWCPHCLESISHGENDECPAFARKTQKLISRNRNRSKQSYAAAVKTCTTIPLCNQYDSLSDDSDNPDEANNDEGCSYWSNFGNPYRRNKNLTAKSVQKSDSDTKKRNRSPEQSGKNKETTEREPKSKKRFAEKTQEKVEKYTFAKPNTPIVNSDTVKNIISSLIGYFNVPPHIQTMIVAIAFPLIDSWWPSFWSSMSKQSGKGASSRISGRHG
jgi:hypothetical protein